MPADRRTITPRAALKRARRLVGPVVRIAPGRKGWGYALRDDVTGAWSVPHDELLSEADAICDQDNWVIGLAAIEILARCHGVDRADASDIFDIVAQEPDCIWSVDDAERVAAAVRIFLADEAHLAAYDAETYRAEGGLMQ